MKTRLILFIAIIYLLNSCKNNSAKILTSQTDTISSLLHIKYAKGFDVDYFSNYKKVVVKNPWEGAKGVQFEYYLVPLNKEIPEILKNKTVIRTPVKRVICLSTTHIALLDYIDETQTICAISGAKYVYNSKLRSKIESAIIPDVGYDQNMDFEKMLSLKPDLVMVYGIGSESAGFIAKLKEFGLPVVYNAEYLENEALGKTEWVKFVSTFFDKEKLAETKFIETEKKYNEFKTKISGVKNRPKVLVGTPFNGTWYVPGGDSYLTKMIADAGGEYIWKEDNGRESLPLNLEDVFVKGKSADVWINIGAIRKKSDMVNIDSRLSKFDAWKSGEIYNNNARTVQGESSDYWESGIVYPELILNDLITIFHPDISQNSSLFYYKKVE